MVTTSTALSTLTLTTTGSPSPCQSRSGISSTTSSSSSSSGDEQVLIVPGPSLSGRGGLYVTDTGTPNSTTSGRSFITKPFSSLRHRVRTSLSTSKSYLPFSRFFTRDLAKEGHIIPTAQHIPHELLIIIIGHLATPYYLAAFSVGGLLARYYRNTYTMSRLNDARKDLLATVRVCQSWNIAGTEVLYARPFLLSPKQVQLFSWALKENPTLGVLVKKVFVLQPEKSKVARLVSQVARTIPDPTQPGFASSLVACTSLESLTFTCYPGPKRSPVFQPWDSKFINISRIGGHLRELAIYGPANSAGGPPIEILSSELTFPSLEVLVMKAVTLKSDHQFPYFPKLHFLRIAMLHRVHDPQAQAAGERFKLGFPISHFPSLKSLTLHHTGALLSIEEEVLRNLDELKLCGTSEREGYHTWATSTSLDSLKHLEFHLNEVGPGRFIVTQYPRRLHTLSLEITFARGREMKVIKAHVLEDFQRTFLSAIKPCRQLVQLAIKCHSTRTEDTSEYDAVMEKIRKDCEEREIELVEKGPRDVSSWDKHEHLYRRLASWPL
ncbi:hypothetical protein NLI96_g300 [Meripilus lineatus]|uniref:Uncharacterized protein n=1 Tax=Meripilus lineatus TaxID=2056292 RepID=A0AAD5VCY7_9APHY|nr:hypothetical protein NLI96_g300 [Physisporinus lineatus]